MACRRSAVRSRLAPPFLSIAARSKEMPSARARQRLERARGRRKQRPENQCPADRGDESTVLFLHLGHIPAKASLRHLGGPQEFTLRPRIARTGVRAMTIRAEFPLSRE